MGVSGLLTILKSIQRHTTLKAYSGQTLGVDGFGWLHRGAVACASELALGKPTDQYVWFVVRRVRMLLDFGITPYIVFDGDSLPSKSGTNMKRRKERDASKELGMALHRSGRTKEAVQEFSKAVTVTPQMTFSLIEVLRQMNVQILVAPFEADAQLAYLEKQGIIDGILSEDSDLLVFGAKKLITKLDQYGSCIEVNRTDLILNKDISFAGFSDTMFRRMAVLSGCDYLPSIYGVGLRKAHEVVKKHKEIEKIVRVLALQGKFTVPKTYVADFHDAERAFLYHRVFCPTAGKLVLLNTLPPDLREDEMPFLGEDVPAEIALGVACGDLNPKTKQPFTSMTKPSIKTPVARHALQENRRQTTGSSNDLKSKRSIDNFFAPTRKPLAELDPNSLTPSPSQQRVLLRNANASWEPRLANSAPPLRRTVTDVVRSNSTPDKSKANRSAFLAKAAAPSSFKPVKRQRMCSASDEVSPSKEIKQSKYFAPTIVDLSPLNNRKTRGRNLARGAFDVYSDDLVENAIINVGSEDAAKDVVIEYPVLPVEAGENAVALETDFVPQSSPVKAPASPVIESQSSHGTVELQAVTLDSQSTNQGQGTSQTEINEVEDPRKFTDLLNYHVSQLNEATQTRGVSRTFSCQSLELQSAALASLEMPRHGDPIFDKDEEDLEPEAEELLSPRRSAMNFQSIARTFACQSAELQSRAFQSLEKAPALPTIGHLATNMHAHGSEDAIPFSSSQDDVSEAEDSQVGSINLKKFQYIGA